MTPRLDTAQTGPSTLAPRLIPVPQGRGEVTASIRIARSTGVAPPCQGINGSSSGRVAYGLAIRALENP